MSIKLTQILRKSVIVFTVGFMFILISDYSQASTRSQINALNKQIEVMKEEHATQIKDIENELNNQINVLKKHSVALTEKIVELENNKTSSSRLDTWGFMFILIAIIIAMLWFASTNSKNMLKNLPEESRFEMTAYAFKQTFGMPSGTVRGILAVIIGFVFIGSAFYCYPGNIPDSIQVITSLVFGFYFGKGKDQLSDLMSSNNNQDDSQEIAKNEAEDAIKKAKKAGASTHATEPLRSAKELFENAKHAKTKKQTIECYKQAKQFADKAYTVCTQLSQNNHIEKLKADYQNLLSAIDDRLNLIHSLNIESKELQSLYEKSKVYAENEQFEKSIQILEQIKGITNVLLKDHDQAKELFEKKLTPDQKQELIAAKGTIDSSPIFSEIMSGSKVIETVFKIINKLSQSNIPLPLVQLFKKRLMNEACDSKEIADILSLQSIDKMKVLKKSLTLALDGFSNYLPSGLIKNIYDIDSRDIESIVVEDKADFENICSFEAIDQSTSFHIGALIQKARKNIIDYIIGDIVKKALPDDISFETYKKVIKQSQLDSDGYATLSSLNSIINIGFALVKHTNQNSQQMHIFASMIDFFMGQSD